MKKVIFKQLALFLTALSFLSRLPCARFLNFLHANSKENLFHKNVRHERANQENPASKELAGVSFSASSAQEVLAEQGEAQLKQALQEQAQINLGKSVVYFPAIGLFLASLAVLPLWAGLAAENFWLQAWLYVAFMAWLSRGLHWDGLADLADACASCSQGEKFWKIIKDSSLGALGALVLVFVLVGYIIVVEGLLAKEQWLSLIWAAAAARLGCLALPAFAPAYSQANLAKIFAYAKPTSWSIFWALALFGLGGFFISWKACSLALILLGALIFYLSRLAKKQGGYNGDFLGAAIVLGELIVLLAFLLVT